MNQICIKAQQDKIGAAYVTGQLIIWAVGQKPTPCHKVRIEHWPFRIYPPQYQLVACIDEGRICPQMLVPYKAVASFSVSRETLDAMGGVAVVHHSGGAEKVKVEVVELAQQQTDLVAADFAREGGMPFPFRLSKLFESGRGADIQVLSGNDVKLHKATGYSESFSLTEAFQNAIGNLPPDTNPYPDKLTNVTVVGVGANFGGIAGLSRMYVTVASYY